ncbi:Hypothetical protein R9X50_00293000 [Acrodontium crateriforme]|uniref:Uncharacterized protein n=1 Tax=Acrodontium crateriforme TaxID=150365 RepID=A0AAQ3M812_9PEZI|nr:Hypothetical protein R9X50_00293000 [Acrodontium crateriforme]
MDPRNHLHRLQSNLANAAPSRSHTDLPTTSPEKRSERIHLHKRIHSNTVSSKHQTPSHSHRQRAKDTVQSAIELKPPVSLEHLLRREKKGPETSRQGSSEQQRHNENSEEWQTLQELRAKEAAMRRVKPQDVEKAKAENAKRDEQLRQRLKQVEDIGMDSTRQLDDTYYAILEKASMLRSIVAGLQQLAEESRRMHTSFKEETAQLEQTTRQDLESFNNFTQQEQAIDDLVARLKASKAETEKLNQRLEKTRLRIEAYEKRESAKESKRRKQWHATWGTLLGIVVVLLSLVFLKHYQSIALKVDGVGKTLAEGGEIIEDIMLSSITKLTSASHSLEDPYLEKLFDEL